MRCVELVTFVTFAAAGTLQARMNPTLTAEVVDTQQSIFSSGGTLEIDNSSGALEIAGWDQPEIELVVKKTARHKYTPDTLDRAVDALDRIVISTDSQAADHVVIRTAFPSRSILRPLNGKSNVRLTYTIHVPRQTKLIVKHDAGEIKVHDVSANMLVSSRTGLIDVSLPDNDRYSVDAKVRIGAVNSDVETLPSTCEGAEELAPHQLQLRIGTGEITVHKFHIESARSML